MVRRQLERRLLRADGCQWPQRVAIALLVLAVWGLAGDAAADPPSHAMRMNQPSGLADPRGGSDRRANALTLPLYVARLPTDTPLLPLRASAATMEASIEGESERSSDSAGHSVSEGTIADLAFERAWTATLLERQASHVASQAAGQHRTAPPSGALTQIFLCGQAARQRGDAIAQALQGHYALRMLVEQEKLLETSLQTATALQQQIERAIELGLATPGDESLWQVQSTLAELRDRRAQVQGRSAEIRQQMAARLQAPWLCEYLPADSLDPALPSGECAQWCSEALAQRADYRSWQRIISRMDASSLPEAESLVDQLIPAWTAAAPVPSLLLRHLPLRMASRRSNDLVQMRSQMSQALQGFGSQICAEVQTAAIQLETALIRADLAEEQVELIQQQLRRVRQLAEIGQDDAAEDARWVLRGQQAQLQRLARLGEAKQAELEMRRLMGFWDR